MRTSGFATVSRVVVMGVALSGSSASAQTAPGDPEAMRAVIGNFLGAAGEREIDPESALEMHESEVSLQLSYVGHLRAYGDVSESTNIDLGVSYARGHNASGVIDEVDVGRHQTQLYGIDATFRWRPLRRAIYNSFIGRGEMLWSRREQPDAEQNSRGFYLSGDCQLSRRWFTGARYDWSNRADDESLTDRGQSLLVTYKPSEFSQIRGQYRRTRFAIGLTANELLIRSRLAHGAHPF